MRAALKRSLDDRPDGRIRHDAGDLVLCTSCGKPLFTLERAINLGDKASSLVDAFAPVRVADLRALAGAAYVDAGITAWARALTPEDATKHADAIPRPKAGDAMICPFCAGPWPQVLTVEHADTIDRAYTLELLTVPLVGRAPAVRGRRIGATGDWLHEGRPS